MTTESLVPTDSDFRVRSANHSPTTEDTRRLNLQLFSVFSVPTFRSFRKTCRGSNQPRPG